MSKQFPTPVIYLKRLSLFVIGLVALGSVSASVTGTWTTLTSGTAVSRSCVVYVNSGVAEYVYSFGGGAGATLLEIRRYHIAANTWTVLGTTLNQQVSAGTAINFGDTAIYIFGGENAAGTLGSTQVFNLNTNTVTTLATMPVLKTDVGAVKYADSLVYAIGGDDGLFGAGASTDVQVYNVNTNTWSTASPYPLAVSKIGIGISGNTIIAACGWNGTTGTPNAFSGTIDPSDPSLITWSSIPDYPVGGVTRPASGFVQTVSGIGGVFLAGGAINGATVTDLSYFYNAFCNQWEQLNNISQARSNLKAACSGSRAWICSGFTTVAVSTTERLDVTATNFSSSNQVICSNETFTFNGVALNTPGVYKDTLTAQNGCDSVVTLNLFVNPAPVVDLGGPYVQCDGTVLLDAGSDFDSYIWSTGSPAQTIVVNLTGTYSVTVVDESSCSASGSADVTINISPAVNLGGPYNQCGGTVNLDAGNFGASFLWSTGAVTQTITASTSGTYSVTVTSPNTCTASATTSVTISLPPLNTTGYTICQYNAVPSGDGFTASGCGNVAASFSGQTTLQHPTFQRSGTGVSYNPSGIGTATHYATHTFSVGTTGAYTFTLCGYNTYLHIYQGSFDSNFPATGFLVADDDAAPCLNGSRATVTLTAGVDYVFVVTGFSNNDVGNYIVTFTGPGPVYDGPVTTVLWYDVPAGGSVVGTGSPFNPVGTALLPNTNSSGTFTFYAACPATPDCRTPVNFVVNPAPVVALGGPYNQCGGTATLDAGAGNITYSWSDGTAAQTTAATTSGTYSVSVVNSFNCIATGSVEVYIQPVPVVNLGLDVTQCGGSVTLDAGNPGNGYLWSNGSTGQTLTVNSTANYSVTVTDANSNCTASDNISVTINPVPVVDLGFDVVQCGGIVTLNAENAGADYLWSDNSTGQTLVVSTSGVYRVTVTNSSGCSATGSVTVTINANPSLGADKTDSVCPGYTVDLNSYYPNTGYASYAWNTNTPSAAGAGIYLLEVTNAAGCADTAKMTIVNKQKPNLGADLADSICMGYTYNLWVLYPPSPSYTSYVWDTPTPSEVTAGIYTLIVFNASGCSDTLVAVITTRQQPDLGEDKADSVCVGYSLNLTTYYPNTGYATYLWNTATPDSVGAGTYTLIVSNTSGCSDTAVMTVTYRQQPVVTLNMPTEMCYTEPPFTLSGGLPAGGVYVVRDSVGVIVFDPVAQGIGTYHITYIYTNSSGCTDSASIDFIVRPQPHVTTTSLPDMCTGTAPVNLNNHFTPTGGVFTGLGVSQHYFYPSIAGAGNDTIIYYYTDQYGCKDTSIYPWSVKNSVAVSLSSSEVDYTICRGDSITFTALGAELYEFFVNGVSQGAASASNTFTTTSLGSHDEIYVVGSNSCSTDTSESIIIDVITLPNVTAGPDTTIELGQSIMLDAKATGTGSLVFDWLPDYFLNFSNVPNPTYSGPDTVTFVVKVTDIYGCRGTDTITVNVFVPENILLPNILTPNGDGKNDRWIVNAKINLRNSELIIFNRWGEMVYEAENYDNKWDGTYRDTGKIIPDGTYYYVLKVPDHGTHIYKGAINVLNSNAK